MNIFKGLLFITFLTASLAGCSEDTSNSDKVYKIDGAFGLKLGDKGPGLPDGYITNNKAFDFTPNTPHKSFNSYAFSVTPNTHDIYGIKVTSSKELAKANCIEKRNEMVKETLAALGNTENFKINENGIEWKIREDNNRSITIDCKSTLTPATRQLVMIVSDTALSKVSFVEWSKHQDDIAK